DLGRWLESKWIRTPNGKGTTWSHSTIAQILRNRVYLGEQTHGEFVNPHAHDPIVTEMEFNAAQVAKPVRQSAPKAHSANSLLMGLARCAGCGHTLKIVTGHGGKLRYYCKGPYTTGPCPARCLIRVDELDPWVENWFLDQIRDNVRVRSAGKAKAKTAKAQQAVEAAEQELDAFVRLSSALDAKLFRAGIEERQRKLELAKLDLAEALSEAKVYGDIPDSDLVNAWPSLSVQRKRLLLAAFVDKILVSRGEDAIADRVQFVRDNMVIPHTTVEAVPA